MRNGKSKKISLKDFFSNIKCDSELIEEMSFGNFKDFLLKNDLISDEESLIKEEEIDELKVKIEDMLESSGTHYYTWKSAVKKTELKRGIFYDTMIDLGFYDEDKDCYTERGKKTGIEYGLLTDKILDIIEDKAGKFYNINDVFLIQWFGPFESIDKCQKWENNFGISKSEFNFYFAFGKIKGKREKKLSRFYIGISEQDFISNRISSITDPVTRDFLDNYEKKIWIGRFSDKKLRYKNKSANKKKRHNHIDIVEWGLIFGFQKANPYKTLQNEKKTANPPKRHICIVNQFFNKDSFKILRRKTNIAKYIPDVILYGGDECIKLCQTLRKVDSEE
ncbi:MAG: hypothetical protein IJP61_07335 [Treponema sp.]|nr:hypothetical protein [Treponema sp.]